MERRDAILEALSYAGLDASHAGAVEGQLELPRESWPRCCDSGCDPCVEQIHRATLRARALLGLGDPG